ncbi:hypothetical protein T492DRAFT_850142 [Pavlovales sp. CCMP2436]|nr:hypothetical protein T492DRAFT_850142 [Pavlovales sp. CCMP2436]
MAEMEAHSPKLAASETQPRHVAMTRTIKSQRSVRKNSSMPVPARPKSCADATQGRDGCCIGRAGAASGVEESGSGDPHLQWGVDEQRFAVLVLEAPHRFGAPLRLDPVDAIPWRARRLTTREAPRPYLGEHTGQRTTSNGVFQVQGVRTSSRSFKLIKIVHRTVGW